MYNSNIAFLFSPFGVNIFTFLSNLPDLNRAGSNKSKVFVAPIKNTSSVVSNPSSSVSNCVNALTSSPLVSSDLFFPNASISSMNKIVGAFSRASLNIFLISLGESPTYLRANSLPALYIKCTLHSLLMALAIILFPVPGFPYNNIFLGILAPIASYFSLFLINLII